MKEIKRGTNVLCKADGEVHRVVQSDKHGVFIYRPNGIAYLYYDDIRPLVAAPVDEKNISSDWIDGELLDPCIGHGDEFMGWINGRAVYIFINKIGFMYVKVLSPATIDELKGRIMELFKESSDHIVVKFLVDENGLGMTVAFYFIDPDYEE